MIFKHISLNDFCNINHSFEIHQTDGLVKWFWFILEMFLDLNPKCFYENMDSNEMHPKYLATFHKGYIYQSFPNEVRSGRWQRSMPLVASLHFASLGHQLRVSVDLAGDRWECHLFWVIKIGVEKGLDTHHHYFTIYFCWIWIWILILIQIAWSSDMDSYSSIH